MNIFLFIFLELQLEEKNKIKKNCSVTIEVYSSIIGVVE